VRYCRPAAELGIEVLEERCQRIREETVWAALMVYPRSDPDGADAT
jgi:hypothetical protein